MKPKLNITGQLKVTKVYVDNKPDEVVIDCDNLISIGMQKMLGDIMEGIYDPNIQAQDITLGWLQLGSNSQDDWASNRIYELSSAFTTEQFGDHTNLVLATEDILYYEDPINEVGLSSKPNTFINLRSQNLRNITTISDSTVCYTLLIDQNTLNGETISEAGLFFNTKPKGREKLLQLGAYKAFGFDDGLGISSPIAKSKDFLLQIEWTLSINVQNAVTVTPLEVGDTYAFYKSPFVNPEGNAWVCYFPDITKNNTPPTKDTVITNDLRDNIEEDYFRRLLQNGISVVAFDYSYPRRTSDTPIFTSSYGSNVGLVPSSTSPYRLPNGLTNCFTDAASSIQFVKEKAELPENTWNLNPSNVILCGNGFGSTLASFLAYGPDGSAAGPTPVVSASYEDRSTRALAVANRDGVMDWMSWYPYTLDIFDFKFAGIPKQLNMSGSIYEEGGLLMSSSTSYFDSLDEWATSSLSSIGDSSSLLFDSSDFNSETGFYWSAIPSLKELYQWREIPLYAKHFWSPIKHAPEIGDEVNSDDMPGISWGHLDNSGVYSLMCYTGNSTSSTSIYSVPYFRIYDKNTNSYINMGDVEEPGINLDFSGAPSSIDVGNAPVYSKQSQVSENLADVAQGRIMLNALPLNAQVSSAVNNYSPSKDKTIGSPFVSGAVSVYKCWDAMDVSRADRDRTEWILRILINEDSWYNQFLGLENAVVAPPDYDPINGKGMNVVFIMADDLGIDSLGLYDSTNVVSGNPYQASVDPFGNNLYPHTPTLSAMAAGGLLFTDARSNTMCTPTRANILTGKNAFSSPGFEAFDSNPKSQKGFWGHGFATVITESALKSRGGLNGLGSLIPILDQTGATKELGELITSDNGEASVWEPGNCFKMLPTLLREKGYKSGMVGKWHLAEWNELVTYRESADGGSTFIESSGDGWNHISRVGRWDDYRATFHNLNKSPIPGHKNYLRSTTGASTWDNLDIADANMGYINYYLNNNGTVITVSDTGYTTFLESATGNTYVQGDPDSYCTNRTFAEATSMFNSLEEPFFMYLPLNAPHAPYTYPPSGTVYTSFYNNNHVQSAASVEASSTWINFNAMIENIDYNLDNFLSSINSSRKNRTIFIFMGDNGSDILPLNYMHDYASGSTGLNITNGLGVEYDKLINPDNYTETQNGMGGGDEYEDSNERFKSNSYERGVRVPLIVSASFIPPGLQGTQTSAMVDAIDIYATIADIARVIKTDEPLLPGQATRYEGHSFLPIVSGLDADNHQRNFSFFEYFTPAGSSRGQINWTNRGTYSGSGVKYSVATIQNIPWSSHNPAGATGYDTGNPVVPTARRRGLIVKASASEWGAYIPSSTTIPLADYGPIPAASAGTWKLIRPTSGTTYQELYHLKNSTGDPVDPYEFYDHIPQVAKGSNLRNYFLALADVTDPNDHNWIILKILAALEDSLVGYLNQRVEPQETIANGS